MSYMFQFMFHYEGLGRASGNGGRFFLSSVFLSGRHDLTVKMGRSKQTRVEAKRKREDLSSQSSENSLGTPEAKHDGRKHMASVDETPSKAAVCEEASQVPALAAIWEAVLRIEANTNLLIKELQS